MTIEKQQIWFSSDWHFNHTNIAGPKVSSWKGGYRDFDSVHEMNETIIKNINDNVQQNDIIYFLGDFCFGGHHLTPEWRKRIICSNIHWIKGNHDEHAYLYKDYFSSVKDYSSLNIKGIHFELFHYSMRIWKGSHKGYFHLYGHSHSNIEHLPLGKSMDVGIDNAYKIFGEYRPFHIDEVLKILNKREIHFLDHHTRYTNV